MNRSAQKMASSTDELWMRRAIRLARSHSRAGHGGPFGAVIIRDGVLVASGWNRVTSRNDPTAHAEVVAIRAAGRKLATFELRGCILYTSCEPCPMCLAAAYWARLDRVVHAATRDDAARIGFDDARLYRELTLPNSRRRLRTGRCSAGEARAMMEEWFSRPDRQPY